MADEKPTQEVHPVAAPEIKAEQNSAPEEEHTPSILSNILAFVGIIIFVIIIVWGLAHLVSLSSGWFSSLFSSTPSLGLHAPANVTDGTSFTVQWDYTPSSSGTYALLYECGSVTFSNNNAHIPCGSSYTISASSSSLSLVPTLAGDKAATTSLSLIFVPASGPGVQGDVSFVVDPAAQKTLAKAPATPAPMKKVYAGPADLVVRIISVTADQYGNGVAVFDIANRGSGTAGSYYFKAELPTSSYGPQYYGAPQGKSYTYTSPAQISLAPGDHVTSTLRFTNAVPGGVFSVTVDPSEMVNDPDRTNNYAYQTLTTPYGTPTPTYTY